MSEEYQRIEVITGVARRRHWSTEAKLRIIEESFEPGETVSSVARRNGVAPNLLYRWRRLLSEEVRQPWYWTNPWSAVRNSGVFRSGCAHPPPAWPQDHGERDPPGSARQVASKKTDLAAALACEGRFAVKRIAEVLGVSRSNLADRHNRGTRPRGAYRKADDEDLLPLIRPPLRRRAADIWLPPHHGAGEPGTSPDWTAHCQPQTGAPDYAAGRAAPGAPYWPTPGARS